MCESVYNVLWWKIRPYARPLEENGNVPANITGSQPSGLIIDEVKEILKVCFLVNLGAGALMNTFSKLMVYYYSNILLYIDLCLYSLLQIKCRNAVIETFHLRSRIILNFQIWLV